MPKIVSQSVTFEGYKQPTLVLKIVHSIHSSGNVPSDL